MWLLLLDVCNHHLKLYEGSSLAGQHFPSILLPSIFHPFFLIVNFFSYIQAFQNFQWFIDMFYLRLGPIISDEFSLISILTFVYMQQSRFFLMTLGKCSVTFFISVHPPRSNEVNLFINSVSNTFTFLSHIHAHFSFYL